MGIITKAISSALGLTSDPGWQWRDNINAASFRGVPFAVTNGEGVFGRRVAVHEYPFKDSVYVEDLGRSTRKFTVRGFLIQGSKVYSAPDVFTQRDNLIAACEQSGVATLVHPTLGEMSVFVPDGGLQINESSDSERVFEFTLTCIEGGEKEFSINLDATLDAKASWLKTMLTTASRYINIVKGEFRSIAYVIKTVKATIEHYTGQAKSSFNSVSNLGNVLGSTFGNKIYGRFNTGKVGGSVSGVAGVTSREKNTNNAKELVEKNISSSVMDREDVLHAIEDSENIHNIEDIPEKVQNIIEEIIDSTGSVKEKIIVFENLANSVGQSSNRLIKLTESMLLCMSAASMTLMALQYIPRNLDEAQEILNRVCTILEKALLMCADCGDDDSYLALLGQRNYFIKTYTQKFATLSSLIQVNLTKPFPALSVANTLYQDAARSDELVQAANPIHPAFMPIRFKARKN